jgi:predicted dehydrogenase
MRQRYTICDPSERGVRFRAVPRPIGIALLGAGWMGDVHSSSYRRVPFHYPECEGQARLVVVADEVEARARKAAEAYGYESFTTDWREALAHPEVDAISLTAPNFLHRDMAVAAAEAGKHLRAEKPLGRVPAETLEICEAVERAGVTLTVGLNYRHAPAVQHAAQLIAGGALGEPNHFRMQMVASYAASPKGALSWRFLRDQAGLGILGDLGSHALDLAQMLLGPIVRVTATSAILVPHRPVPAPGGTHFSVVEEGAELRDVENEDWVAALVEFERGVRGTIELSRVMVGADARYLFEVNGPDGSVSWNFERMNELELLARAPSGETGVARVLSGPSQPDFAAFQPGTGIQMGFDDLKVIEARIFLQSVADGQTRPPGVAEIASAARVLDAIDRSCRSSQWEDVR